MTSHKKLSKRVFIIVMILLLGGILYIGYTDSKKSNQSVESQEIVTE